LADDDDDDDACDDGVCVCERERGYWDGIRLTGLIENRSYGALTE
jgi:hypothetical protein